MQELRLVGVHEDGEHLLLVAPDGEHYTVALDEPLRAAARRDRPHLGHAGLAEGGMRPREVQALVRAGASTQEIAARAGWTVEKVRKYEGPILAERTHVAEQARRVRVRSRGGVSGSGTPTLQARVAQRMRERGVDPEANAWDAWRGEGERRWTVVLTFAAGGRQRQASWAYDPVLGTVEAADDEARWLSADEPAVPGPSPASPARAASVYDVEAEGGVAATSRRASTVAPPEGPVDLMTAMRQRTTVGRRANRSRAGSADAARRVAPDATAPLPLHDGPGPDVTPAERPVQRQPRQQHSPEPALSEQPTGVEQPTDRDESTAGGPATPSRHTEPSEAAAASEQTGPRPADAEPHLGEQRPAETVAPAGTQGGPHAGAADATERDEAADAPVPAPPRGRKPRPSVPSWDDVMFGARRR